MSHARRFVTFYISALEILLLTYLFYLQTLRLGKSSQTLTNFMMAMNEWNNYDCSYVVWILVLKSGLWLCYVSLLCYTVAESRRRDCWIFQWWNWIKWQEFVESQLLFVDKCVDSIYLCVIIFITCTSCMFVQELWLKLMNFCFCFQLIG